MTGTTSSEISPRRGDVYLVNFDPTVGFEIRKTRPAVIIQNNIGNRFSQTVIVAAITGDGHKASKLIPVSVFISKDEAGLSKDSLVLLTQIRTVDKRRLGKRLGQMSEITLQKIDQELKTSLGLE